MPTSLRSSIRPEPLAVSVWPATLMLPLLIISRPLIQRNMVLLPEPLRPMMAMTCPRSTDKEIPFSTWTSPNFLVMLSISTMGMQFLFQEKTKTRQRVAHHKIKCRNNRENNEGLESRIADQLACQGQFHQANNGGYGGVLDKLHQEAHGGGQRNADGLGQDHVAQLLPAVHCQRCRGLPLRHGHGFNRAPPDVAQIGCRINRHRDSCRHHRWHLVAENCQPIERQEQDDQYWGALDDLNIDCRHEAQHPRIGGAQKCHDKTGQPTKHKC